MKSNAGMYTILFLALLLVIVVFFTSHGQFFTGQPTLDIVGKAKQECTLLPGDAPHACASLIDRRIAGYQEYSRTLQSQIDAVQPEREHLAYRAEIARKMCESSNETECTEYETLRMSSEQLQTRTDAMHATQETVARRVSDAIAQTPGMFAKRGSNVAVVCKIRDTGKVDCVTMAAILAAYDTEMDTIILDDISRLYVDFGLDPIDRVLWECQGGAWGASGLPELGMTDIPEIVGSDIARLVDSEAADAMLDRCAKIREELEESLSSLTGKRGYSGITGFDPYGLLTPCGPNDLTTGFGEFTGEALTQAEAFRDRCEASLGETLTEGDTPADPDLVPIPKKEKKDGKKTQKQGTNVDLIINDNGDGTETVWGTIDGQNVNFVRYRTGTIDGTQMKSTSDGEGNSIETVYTPGRGTVTTTINRDGAQKFVTTRNEKGDLIQSNRYGKQGDDWKLNGIKMAGKPWRKPKDCGAGDPCTSCIDWAEFMPDQMDRCMASAGLGGSRQDAYSCSRYSKQSECCSNPDAFFVDPRLIVPNPEGDMVCMGGTPPDKREELCSAQCSVASYEGDCKSRCMSHNPLGGDHFDIWDRVCRMAITEEDCGSNGGREPGSVPVEPEPLPLPDEPVTRNVLDEHTLIPPIRDVRRSPAGGGEVPP